MMYQRGNVSVLAVEAFLFVIFIFIQICVIKNGTLFLKINVSVCVQREECIGKCDRQHGNGQHDRQQDPDDLFSVLTVFFPSELF